MAEHRRRGRVTQDMGALPGEALTPARWMARVAMAPIDGDAKRFERRHGGKKDLRTCHLRALLQIGQHGVTHVLRQAVTGDLCGFYPQPCKVASSQLISVSC